MNTKLFLLFVTCVSFMQTHNIMYAGEILPIPLYEEVVTLISNGQEPSKSPGQIVEFLNAWYNQDNHTLSFERCCIGSQIEIVQNGNVVYSTFITNEDGTVELPPYIIGECELRLRWGGFLFEGEFIIQ